MLFKKLSIFLIGFLFVVSAVYGATVLNGTYYGTNDENFDIEIWKDGGTISNHTFSMSDDAIVRGDANYPQTLEVSASGGTLTFYEQRIWKWGLPGNLTEFGVDFDGNGIYTQAVLANTNSDTGTVTLEVPSSELTDVHHVYSAKVKNDVAGIPMSADIEFYMDLTNCN